MASNRGDILDWIDQGRIAPERMREAMERAELLPDAADWRRFIDRVLLFMGVVMLGTGTIFFFAFNWQELGRYGKFALVEVPILVALAFAWRLDVEGIAGKATLLLASILTGALLALVGQTYQTGADTFELFAVWAGAILPWVLVARFPALWILWLGLVNAAVSLYFLTFGILWGMLFAPEKLLWLLFGVNTAALVAWEGLALGGFEWLRERWSVRMLATASGGIITALCLHGVLDWRGSSHWGLPLWLAWLAAAYAAYRSRIKDVYVLAGGALSVIVVVITLIGKQMRWNSEGEFLFISLLVIGMSGAAGYWLKQVAAEEEA